MQPDLSLLIVFTAGLLSFLSPCVLPLIPGYIAFVTGISVADLTDQGGSRRKMASALFGSFLFVLGFSAVFVALGATATWLGALLTQRLPLLVNVAGVVIVIFGIHQLGLLKFNFLMVTKQVDLSAEKLGPLKAPLLGAAFAFGWTPCIGPVLTVILATASEHQSRWAAVPKRSESTLCTATGACSAASATSSP